MEHESFKEEFDKNLQEIKSLYLNGSLKLNAKNMEKINIHLSQTVVMNLAGIKDEKDYSKNYIRQRYEDWYSEKILEISDNYMKNGW